MEIRQLIKSKIVLHPRDPHKALEEQKNMICDLKEQGYTFLSYKGLIPMLKEATCMSI